MKWSRLNAVFFACNLVLLGALGMYLYNHAGVPLPVQTTETQPETNLPVVVEKIVPQTVVVTNQLRWRQLETEDYREYIARLRSIGCPEQTIRDIIIADLDKLYAPRVQATQGRRKDLKYWQSEEEELANNINAQEQQKQERALDQEKRRIIVDLLGVDLVRERLKQRGVEDYYERRLAFLSEEKRGPVRQLLEKYDQQEQAIRNKEIENGEPITPADTAELQRLRLERQSQVAKLLSPSEATQMELWLSPSANLVRHDMYGMNATEEEFQTIYQMRKAFDEKFQQPDVSPLDDRARAQYDQAKADLENKIRQQLGEERYAEYQRGSDEEYHQLAATATRFNLPAQTAAQVYETRKIVQQMNSRVMADPNLTQEQKQKALQDVAAEAQREVKSVLGDKAYSYYLWRGQGYWLNKSTSTPAP